ALTLFAIAFIGLGLVGAEVVNETIPKLLGPGADVLFWRNVFGRIMTVIYFGFFIFLWAYTYFGVEKTKPVPDRVTTHE
ncbi:MAG: cytochrome b, partial [Xanthomonadales bacterium]|nr:cytochrome b [Xanthomonadales bacterium]